mmetsp:Transcript_88996/g.157587  ORF Transcript_88996/g.157587 Transcript_88996/m.157587 type:complete len:649 (+) Transcript_88996:59-2005(+)
MMALQFVLLLAPVAVQSLVYGTRKTPMQQHPYLEHLQQLCGDELSSFVDEGASFYEAVDHLQDFKSQLSNPCHKAMFNASGAEPNKLIFKTAAWQTGTKSGQNVSVDLTLVLGYIDAPLFYNMPEKSPLFKTWFGIVPSRKQPAPKGILFIHTGGPRPSIMSGARGALDLFEEDHWEHIIENYDIVSVDQRGMGLSGADLFEGLVVPDDPRDLFAVAEAGYTGQLTAQVNISGQSVTALCYNLSQEADFFEPEDWANLSEVSYYLDQKMKLTVACSEKYDRDNGEGGTYNLLQYMGTEALVHDLEWLRLSLGASEITLLGYSYGTRVVAAYSSMFPKRIVRTGVSGVMGPYADILHYAKAAALNTGEILGFIQSQCLASSTCTKNPFAEGEANEDGFYFDGDINDAVDELFARSSGGGEWYTGTCGARLPLKNLLAEMQRYLTDTAVSPVRGYQEKTWPWGFAALPSLIFYAVQNPCSVTALTGNRTSAWFDLSVFSLVPALDMTGRWSRNQVAAFITETARDSTMTPGLNMFLLYATAAHGWPQLPTPIGFDQPQVNSIIAQALYDERTGLNMAQDYKIRFPNSSLVSSLSGGHCVGPDHGFDANALLTRFIIHGDQPRNAMVAGRPLKIDFETGSEKFKAMNFSDN